LGRVGEVVDGEGADRLTVKFNKYEWLLNPSACERVTPADFSHIEVSGDHLSTGIVSLVAIHLL